MIASLFRGYLACISIIQHASATPKYGGGGLYFTAGFLSALSLHYIKVPSWDSLTGVAGFMGHHNNLPTYRIAENLGLVPRRKVPRKREILPMVGLFFFLFFFFFFVSGSGSHIVNSLTPRSFKIIRLLLPTVQEVPQHDQPLDLEKLDSEHILCVK